MKSNEDISATDKAAQDYYKTRELIMQDFKRVSEMVTALEKHAKTLKTTPARMQMLEAEFDVLNQQLAELKKKERKVELADVHKRVHSFLKR